MCGIVGDIGHREALSVLIPGLRRLKYQSFDSVGVARVNGRGLEMGRYCAAAA